ncbi:MAG: FAD-dependent oxidoreductase, partial [Sciscionella sp.]
RQLRGAAGGRAAVVLQGSIVDVEMAQAALSGGVADLVEMTRAQIAEPELLALLRAGTPQRIRPCVLCNQRCRVRDDRNPIVTCIGDPRSGHETEDPAPSGVDAEPARVLVIGGGPAGMEAARVLANRGHSVELCEAGERLGGLLPAAATLAGRGRIALLGEWLAGELSHADVHVNLGSHLTEGDVESALLQGKHVVLAVGSVPGLRDYPVDGSVDVLDVVELLTGAAELPHGRVVVVDPVGDWVGVGTAELLAQRGHQVTIVSQDQVIGTQLALTGDLADANARLQRAGVVLAKRSVLRSATRGTAVIEDSITGQRQELDCAAIVHCGHRLPAPSLWVEDPRVVVIGDAVAPRTIHEAILEGRRGAMAVATAAHQVVLT